MLWLCRSLRCTLWPAEFALRKQNNLVLGGGQSPLLVLRLEA